MHGTRLRHPKPGACYPVSTARATLTVMTCWLLIITTVSAVAAWFTSGEWRWGAASLACASILALGVKVRRHIRRRVATRTLAGLRSLHPDDFEVEVARWLRREGWSVEHRGGTGDGGIDLVATRGRETLAVQCKRYADTAAVSSAQVRDLYGAAVATGSTRAALVTTGRISRAATNWCESLPDGPRLQLFDAEAVGRLAIGERLIGA